MASSGSASFDLGRRSGQCAATGEVLDPGTRVVAALVDVYDEASESFRVERLEFAEEAWSDDRRPQGFIARWRTVVPERDDKANTIAIDADSMLGLFEQLEDTENDHRVALRYVLALLMIRKRMLEPAGSEERGVLLVRLKNDETVHRVVEPALAADQLSELGARLSEALGLEGA
ncbi:MAG: hypothetical protein AAGB34_11360 [Planctomycetota bacterium]